MQVTARNIESALLCWLYSIIYTLKWGYNMCFWIKLRNPPGMDNDSKSELEAAEAGADDEDDGSGKFLL